MAFRENKKKRNNAFLTYMCYALLLLMLMLKILLKK